MYIHLLYLNLSTFHPYLRVLATQQEELSSQEMIPLIVKVDGNALVVLRSGV